MESAIQEKSVSTETETEQLKPVSPARPKRTPSPVKPERAPSPVKLERTPSPVKPLIKEPAVIVLKMEDQQTFKPNDLKRKIDEIDQNTDYLSKLIDKAQQILPKLVEQRSFLFKVLSNLHTDPHPLLKDVDADPYEYQEIEKVEEEPADTGLGAPMKKKKTAIDPNAPKKPANAYMVFCAMERDNVLKEKELRKQEGVATDEDLTLKNMTKELEYNDIFKEQLDKWQEEMKAYKLKVNLDTPIADLNSRDMSVTLDTGSEMDMMNSMPGSESNIEMEA